MTKIEYFLFENNLLEGPLPEFLIEYEFAGNAINISLKNNNLSGSIPNSLLLYGWDNIDLSHNNLEGELTTESLANFAYKGIFNFSDNNLSGPLPSSLSHLIPNTKIDLSNNDFEGCFPKSYFGLCDYPVLSITDNPKLPWLGTFAQYCSGNGLLETQVGAHHVMMGLKPMELLM